MTLKPRSTNPNVVVCSADRAEDHLRHTKHGPGKKVAGLISLASAPKEQMGRQRPSNTAASVAQRKLFLEFDDAVAPVSWIDSTGRWDRNSDMLPTKEDVEKILAFGKDMEHFKTPLELPTRVIIHCYAGQSRSTAAALMLFAQAMRESTDTEILRAFTSSCEEGAYVRPNSLMVKLADEVLGFAGRLRDLEWQLHGSQARMY